MLYVVCCVDLMCDMVTVGMCVQLTQYIVDKVETSIACVCAFCVNVVLFTK